METLYGEQHSAVPELKPKPDPEHTPRPDPNPNPKVATAYENFHNDVSSAQVGIKKKERSLALLQVAATPAASWCETIPKLDPDPDPDPDPPWPQDDLEDAQAPATWEGEEAIDTLTKSIKAPPLPSPAHA